MQSDAMGMINAIMPMVVMGAIFYFMLWRPQKQQQNKRKEMLESIKEIDEVYIYKNIEDDIKKIDFDILAIGPDQQHDGFQKAMQWCRENNKKVILLPRTEGVSSTEIKSRISK